MCIITCVLHSKMEDGSLKSENREKRRNYQQKLITCHKYYGFEFSSSKQVKENKHSIILSSGIEWNQKQGDNEINLVL